MILKPRGTGAFSCAVLTGYNTLEQLRAANPDLIVEHLQELKETLEENNLEVKVPGKRFEQAHFPIATVGALIFNSSNQVLMLRTHKWSNLWGSLEGRLNGETCIDALRRENQRGNKPGYQRDFFRAGPGQYPFKRILSRRPFYSVELYLPLQRELKVLNDEASAFRWATISEGLEMPINLPTRKLLLEGNSEGLRQKPNLIAGEGWLKWRLRPCPG